MLSPPFVFQKLTNVCMVKVFHFKPLNSIGFLRPAPNFNELFRFLRAMTFPRDIDYKIADVLCFSTRE